MGKITELFYVKVSDFTKLPDIQTVVTILQDEKNLDVEFVPLKPSILMVVGREREKANENPQW